MPFLSPPCSPLQDDYDVLPGRGSDVLAGEEAEEELPPQMKPSSGSFTLPPLGRGTRGELRSMHRAGGTLGLRRDWRQTGKCMHGRKREAEGMQRSTRGEGARGEAAHGVLHSCIGQEEHA